MDVRRKRKVRAGSLAIAMAFSGLAWMVTGGGPAKADVTAVSGNAYGVKVSPLLGIPLLPPTPVVNGQSPPINYGPVTDQLLGIAVPGPAACPNVPLGNILQVCAATVSTFGELGATPHLHSANSTATLANVAVGTAPSPLLFLGALEVACRADGNDATGTVNIVGASLGGSPIADGPVGKNTVLELPGLIRVVLNEQIPAVNPHTPGINTIAVNGAHITLFGVTNTDIILGHVECTATGPDVNAGSVRVRKVAPADAQNVPFTFDITCPGVNGGAPQTVTITGTGTSSTIDNIPQGTVCTVSERPVAGFVSQPNQNFPAVQSGAIQEVTFTNVRTAPGTGSLTVTKVAPADAQGVTFDFSINCPGLGTFPRQVTGSGTSAALQGIAAGTVCTVTELPEAGFVDQPAQNAPAILAGQTQNVTFTNVRTAPGTGSLVIVKNAPADAQGVTFNFTITCPNVGTFPVSVTGSGSTSAVSGIPAGTVCTAAETPQAGFVPQANQTFPAAVAGQTQSVTFTNVRTAPGTGSLAIVKNAPGDAQGVTFNFTITCPGVGSFPVSVTGSGTTSTVSGIPAGVVCTASESSTAGFVNQPPQNFPAVVAGQTQTVTFTNQRVAAATGALVVQKVAPGDAQGLTFTFTINCPGFGTVNRQVVGSNTSSAVTGIPAGTVCTVSESPTAGFVDQPVQSVTVVSGSTVTVTFTNTRVPTQQPPTAPGQNNNNTNVVVNNNNTNTNNTNNTNNNNNVNNNTNDVFVGGDDITID